MHSSKPPVAGSVKRVRAWYAILLLVLGIYGVRLFYVQVINYNHYKQAAKHYQLAQYEIPATRGIIEAHDGDSVVPIVLNQTLYTLYTDPTDIKRYGTDPQKASEAIAGIIGGNPGDYLRDMQQPNTRYVVLANRLGEGKKNKLVALKIPGLYTKAQDYRTYPQGNLAAQVLGFVDDSGQGQYGIEQALNNKLAGKPGQLKATTDVHGVPLAADSNNIDIPPTPGDNVVLTIDIAMQKQLEDILAKGTKAAKAPSASALILDANTGAIKAMANYPTYNPAEYYKAKDPKVYNNASVSNAIEVGSIMKTLTTSAALDQGVIQPNTTFYDPGHWTIDGFNISDVEHSEGEQSIATLLNLSLNTGATWELMQMGGGEINQKARDVWHDYMVNHFLLGQKTGVAQGYEAGGYVPAPEKNGAGINLTYANTAFGQAMTATQLQMAAALSSVLNGGTYYKPRLVDKIIQPNGKATNYDPKVVKSHVVSPQTGKGLESLMQYVVENHHDIVPQFDQSKYAVGGKTGTAQVAKPGGGGYYDNVYNATYLGFVGGNKVQYVIAVFVNHPDTSGFAAGYAGALDAQPIFVDLAHMLINNSYVTPKS